MVSSSQVVQAGGPELNRAFAFAAQNYSLWFI